MLDAYIVTTTPRSTDPDGIVKTPWGAARAFLQGAHEHCEIVFVDSTTLKTRALSVDEKSVVCTYGAVDRTYSEWKWYALRSSDVDFVARLEDACADLARDASRDIFDMDAQTESVFPPLWASFLRDVLGTTPDPHGVFCSMLACRALIRVGACTDLDPSRATTSDLLYSLRRSPRCPGLEAPRVTNPIVEALTGKRVGVERR